MIAALILTLGVLVLGIIKMFFNNSFASIKSNQLMQWRVLAQGLVLIVFTLLLLMKRGHTAW